MFKGRMALPTPYAVAESVATKQREQRVAAVWTMLGTTLALGLFALFTGGFVDYWRALSTFMTGQGSLSQFHSGNMVRLAPTVAAMVVMNLLVMIPVGLLIRKVVTVGHGDHAVTTMFHASKPKQQYGLLMTTLAAEELLARWIFLGIIAQLPLLRQSDLAFYVLFLLGNFGWALLHLVNIKNKNLKLKTHQKIAFVMPQFVGGALITAVYLPYGLLGALIAHVVFDMVLFAADRVDVFNRGEKLIVAYHFVVTATAFVYFQLASNVSLLDMKRWLRNDITSFALPGWMFWDYVVAIIMLTSGATLLLEGLLYDREGGTTKHEALHDWLQMGAFMIAAHTIVDGTRGITYLPMSGVVIVLAMLIPFFVKSRSGSGVARIFWEGMLIASVVICGLMAMDARHGLLLMLIMMVLWLPDRIFRYYDKDELQEVAAEAKA